MYSCTGWCWKWQWRARRRLWLRPTLNWRRSCLTRRRGFPSGTVQSDLRERAALWAYCQQGVQPRRGKEPSQRFPTAWVRQMHLSEGSVHSHLYLFNRMSHHSRAEFCRQCTWRKLQGWVTLRQEDCLLCAHFPQRVHFLNVDQIKDVC